MVFKAVDTNIGKVNDFIHSFLPENCPCDILNKLDLAIEEIFVNIAHYAYVPEEGEADIECSFDGSVLKVTFRDSGKAFNPLEKEEPDITLSAEEREIGGLGIFLTKKFMDSVDYEFKDGCNILTITKRV